MGSEEFGAEVLQRRKDLRLSQQRLADAARVSKSTIDRIERNVGKERERATIIDVAAALDGWDVDEALALMGEPPLNATEQNQIAASVVDLTAEFLRLWPLLTSRQQAALVELVATMVPRRQGVTTTVPGPRDDTAGRGDPLTVGPIRKRTRAGRRRSEDV